MQTPTHHVEPLSFFGEVSCVDVWGSCHLSDPTQRAFTWFRPDGSTASKIDLIGCPESWPPHVPLWNIVPCPVSDHCDVFLSLSSLPDSVSQGPSFQKLNTSVLSEPEYVDEISFWSSWQNFKESYSYLSWIGGIWVRWELSLCLSTTASIILLLKDLNSRHFQMSQLEDQGHVASLSEYRSALSELQTFSLEKARSTQVRSRSRWVKEDEFSSAYFF